MKLSLSTRGNTDNLLGQNGYGYATKCMLQSLRSLGYHIKDNDATADVQIAFDHPQFWKWHGPGYKIGYLAWESTQLQPGWAEIMNQCDEIWAPSPLLADWYKRYNNVTVPIYVYEHGVEHSWEPTPRTDFDKMGFLHVGGETRKGGWDSMRLFREAFPQNTDVEFTLKINNRRWLNVGRVGKTTLVNKAMSFADLQNLFYTNQVYVYPSWGEGFGLTPLQALATGMPTICVPDWAPYSGLLDPDLKIAAELKPSSWHEIHPGKMFRPDFDDVVDKMRYAYNNYDKIHDFAQSNATKVHQRYDWDRLTKEAFEALEKRLK